MRDRERGGKSKLWSAQMDGHLLCNGVLLPLSLSCPHTHTATSERQSWAQHEGTSSSSHGAKRQSDWWERKEWDSDKRTIWTHRCRSKGRGGEERDGQTWTDREYLADLASETSRDKSTRLGLSVFTCVFPCGVCCPVWLREQIYPATGQTVIYITALICQRLRLDLIPVMLFLILNIY